MTAQALEVLRQYPFIEEFDPRHVDTLTMLAAEMSFAAGEVIFREGDKCGRFYVILSGSVALEACHPGGAVLIQTLHAGDELGWSALLDRRKKFQARAVEPVEALAFDAAKLWDACHGDPQFGSALFYRLFTVVARRLQGTRGQLAAALARG